MCGAARGRPNTHRCRRNSELETLEVRLARGTGSAGVPGEQTTATPNRHETDGRDDRPGYDRHRPRDTTGRCTEPGVQAEHRGHLNDATRLAPVAHDPARGGLTCSQRRDMPGHRPIDKTGQREAEHQHGSQDDRRASRDHAVSVRRARSDHLLMMPPPSRMPQADAGPNVPVWSRARVIRMRHAMTCRGSRSAPARSIQALRPSPAASLPPRRSAGSQSDRPARRRPPGTTAASRSSSHPAA